MPPKAKITKEMVIDAAFEVARETGAENINARTVSKKLNCSTQPVMYHFATIEELKKAKELLELEVITQQEFDSIKAECVKYIK